jgi:hypothetical protein
VSSTSSSSSSSSCVYQAWQMKRPVLDHDPKLTRRQVGQPSGWCHVWYCCSWVPESLTYLLLGMLMHTSHDALRALLWRLQPQF